MSKNKYLLLFISFLIFSLIFITPVNVFASKHNMQEKLSEEISVKENNAGIKSNCTTPVMELAQGKLQ